VVDSLVQVVHTFCVFSAQENTTADIDNCRTLILAAVEAYPFTQHRFLQSASQHA